MSSLALIRIFTLLIAFLYGIYSAPWAEIAMALTDVAIFRHRAGDSALFTAGTIGIYITTVVAALLAFVAIPRWHSGRQTLSCCFLLMGICFLTRLIPAYWGRGLPWHIQVTSYTMPLIYSLPPFILAAFLSTRAVKVELDARGASNQSLERTAGRSVESP